MENQKIISTKEKELKKYKCANCNKVLFFGNLQEGFISKDCPRCGERNHFYVKKEVNVKTMFGCVPKIED